jgi:uncharacterized protein (TIGR04255 family)
MTLDLPKADGRVATRSTVHLAICEVQFDEQASIASGSTGLQFHERLGGASGPYPKLESAAGGNIRLELGPAGPIQQSTQQQGWSMESTDGSWSVGLLPNRMGVQVNQAYSGWADFVARLASALGVLQEAVSPAIEQRLGLRIVDRIPGTAAGVDDPAGWEPFITPSFFGALAVPEIARAAQVVQQQLVLRSADDVRCTVRQGLAAVVMSPESPTEYVIDIDVYRESARAFVPDAILSTVGEFREQVESLFGLVATPALLEKVAT